MLLTVIEVFPASRPPHELLDSLPRPFEPRHRLSRVPPLDLCSAPDAERMITPLRKREDASAEWEVASAPDGRRGVDGEVGGGDVVGERPGLRARSA